MFPKSIFTVFLALFIFPQLHCLGDYFLKTKSKRLFKEVHLVPKPSDLVVVVLSQHEGYHSAHANLLRDQIRNEAETLDKDPPKIILSHELSKNGTWTLFPMLPILKRDYPQEKWYIFTLDNTGIKLAQLVKVLSSIDHEKEIFMGHAIYDERPTIIHHFADNSKKFKYPNAASGFAISKSLLFRLNEQLKTTGGPSQDFTIDAAYEFANFVFDEGKGVKLSHLPEFCIVSSKDCATYPKFFHPCSDPVSREKLFVAVKTCRKNHIDRIPIIMKTWLKHVPHFGLFTNESDDNLPNIHIVPHTDRGHCAKTRAILEHSYSILQDKNMDWLLIVDDDTIISIGRLTRLLTCYNSKNDLALGERYGFRMSHSSNIGYDYLTGGAGIVVSKSLVKKILETEICECPSPTVPDDMYIFGFCLNLINVHPVHSPLFHQARPLDYATAYLASQEPVSFHKFWEVDPHQVYKHWFAESDATLLQSTKQRHTEL